ncbi:MAG: preprotein translocase subunit SecG [Acidobacteria bacterium]|nr:preprotein translocase subunit SecG [Acidobacteriota bacterium]
MIYVLYTIFFIASILLVATVLLQPGKTDAGALFTSNISSSAFGPRGTASILSKITIVSASVFMVVAFLISLPALQGGTSVLQSVAEPTAESTTQPTEAAANTTEAPAAETNTNSTPAEQPADNSQEAPAQAPANN